jgi:hypothetical protein
MGKNEYKPLLLHYLGNCDDGWREADQDRLGGQETVLRADIRAVIEG